MRRELLWALLVGVGCSGSSDAKPDQAAPDKAPAESKEAPAHAKAEPGPAADDAPGVRDDGSIVSAVTWFDGSLEDALEAAKAAGKLVFVDVGAYWCPPCHELDEETFVDAAVGKRMDERYIAVHIDAEKGEGPDIVARYKVQAYPTLLVLEPSGVEKGRIVDFVPPADLLTALAAIDEGTNVLAKLEAAVQTKPDDLQARYDLGHAYLLQARVQEANEHLQTVEVADPADELGLASQIAFDRAMFVTYKLEGDLPGAIEAYRTLQTRFPDSKSATKAHRQIARILCEQEKPKEAAAQMDQMLAADPDDTGLRSSYGWFAFREHCEQARALQVVQEGLKAAPEDAQLHYLVAELQAQLSNPAEAVAAMAKAAQIESDSAYYKRRLAQLQEEAAAK